MLQQQPNEVLTCGANPTSEISQTKPNQLFDLTNSSTELTEGNGVVEQCLYLVAFRLHFLNSTVNLINSSSRSMSKL